MNKLFIVILAVCLISVNSAVVKREAEQSSSNLDDLQKSVMEFGQNLQKKVADAFDPESIKKSINEGIDNINKLFKPEAPKQ